MEKSIFIALMLFCSSICFSQNTEMQIKETTSTTSTSKSILVTPKSRDKEEIVGRPSMPNLGSPLVEPYSPSPSPSQSDNDNKEKKTSGNKHATKPR